MFLSDPLHKYIPAFAETKVGVERGDDLDFVAAQAPDHDPGSDAAHLRADLRLHRRVVGAEAGRGLRHRGSGRNAEGADGSACRLAVETSAQRGVGIQPLDRRARPRDRGHRGRAGSAKFSAPAFSSRWGWTTPPFSFLQPSLGGRRSRCRLHVYAKSGINPDAATAPPRFESGGGGLYSTIGDYARFLAMLSGGGELDGERILGPRTIRYMASDHLGGHIDSSDPLLAPGHGFRPRLRRAPAEWGCGDAQDRSATISGAAGRRQPSGSRRRISLFAIFMAQAPDYRDHFSWIFRNLYNAAILPRFPC